MRRRSAQALIACNPRRRNSVKDRPFNRRICLITKSVVFGMAFVGVARSAPDGVLYHGPHQRVHTGFYSTPRHWRGQPWTSQDSCERRKLVAPRRQRTPELARKHGVNEVTFCKLASRYVGMDVAQLRCLIANRAFADGATASAGLRDTVVVKLVTAIERSLPLCSHAVAT